MNSRLGVGLVAVMGCVVLTLGTLCQNDGQASGSTRGALSPLEDQDPLGVKLIELWRLDVEDVGSVGGLAAWEDGTIWVGNRDDAGIWEVPPGGGGLRRVRGDGDAGDNPGRTLDMAPMPGGGMVIVGSGGVRVFSDRDADGEFQSFPRMYLRDVAVFDNGDYVVSHGQYPSQPNYDYALHRYDNSGRHIASWHPAFPHDDWRIVTALSGGPVAVTATGDLLMSDPAPFRITRYAEGLPDNGTVVAEDATVVSSDELEASVRADGTWSPYWTQSVFVDELEDGKILNVVRETAGRGRWRSLWVVVSPEGRILARTRFDTPYWSMVRSAPGQYLAVERGSWVVALQVSVEAVVGHQESSDGDANVQSFQ